LSKAIYLAGKMTGVPQFNFPLFERVAIALRLQNFNIISPAELDDPDTRACALLSPDGAPGSGSNNGQTWGDFLSRDIKIVADECYGIALLPGWEKSKGAKLEAFVGLLKGHVFYTVEEFPVNRIFVLPMERHHVASILKSNLI
jgi:hypothetical protein